MTMQSIFTLQIDKMRRLESILQNETIRRFNGRLYSRQVFRIYLLILVLRLLLLQTATLFQKKCIRHNFACMRCTAFLEHIVKLKRKVDSPNHMYTLMIYFYSPCVRIHVDRAVQLVPDSYGMIMTPYLRTLQVMKFLKNSKKT